MAAAAASRLFRECHHEELSEALFHLVKTAQQQQQQQQQQQAMQQLGSKGVNRMQALLLKWLILNTNKTSSSSSSSSSCRPGMTTTTDINQGGSSSSSWPRGSGHLKSSILPVVTDLELQLLAAQLAVKVKRWGVAQAVAGALQQQLTKMVSGAGGG
jgi:hypothetical protein